MASVVILRVWLADRPGALGAVASRIGAVRGDLIGIDILERGGGRAIDELVVSLPDEGLLDLLVNEVSQVDGVDVEEVRPAPDHVFDPRLDALETAALLVGEETRDSLLKGLVTHTGEDFETAWAAIVTESGEVRVGAGPVPEPAWLAAFLAGASASEALSPASPAGGWGPEDLAWAPMPDAGLFVVVGRAGRPFRARERRQLAALARIADRRVVELD